MGREYKKPSWRAGCNGATGAIEQFRKQKGKERFLSGHAHTWGE